jgi:hypothetical protein
MVLARRRKRVLSEDELRSSYPNRPAIITRGVQRLLPRFLAHDIEAFTPHDLRRTGRMSLDVSAERRSLPSA